MVESKHKTHDLITKFESYILDISTMMRVVRSQIQYLVQLQKVFQNPYGDKLGDPRPHKNSYKIPHIHGRMEEMSAAIATLKSMVEERESVFRELRMWESDLKSARSLVCHGAVLLLYLECGTDVSSLSAGTRIYSPVYQQVGQKPR